MAAPKISAITQIGENRVSVVFTEPVMVNDALLSPESYTITPVESGLSVDVVGLLGRLDNAATTYVDLEITPQTEGVLYRISGSDGIKDREGISLDVLSYAYFRPRRTKTDSLIDTLPKLYDKSNWSIIRAVLTAFGKEDERIGGGSEET